MEYNRISTRWTGAGNGKVTALFAVRNNHQQYNNKSKLCWETKRERGRSGLRAMVKASRGSDPNAETKRGPKRRKGEWPFLLPILIVSERICATERKQRNWKISSNRPFPPPSILSLSSFHEWCIKARILVPPSCLSLLPSAQFLPSGWIEDSDQRVRTSSRGRRRGEWGWFRRKVLTPRARSLFKSDFQRDPLS